MLPPNDVADLLTAFAANPNDLGVGLYNPSSGDIRIGSFDRVTQGQGHEGLAIAVGIENNREWRGFLLRPNGTLLPVSHFNLVDGSLSLNPNHEMQIRQLLHQVGLLS